MLQKRRIQHESQRGARAMNGKYLQVVAAVGAVVHLVFAYMESLGWGVEFVNRVAGGWNAGLSDPDVLARVTWARPLAANVAAYNLALAVGLAWLAIAGVPVARSLGRFLSVWLLIAAVAALATGVTKAAAIQGALGLLLLATSMAI